MSARSGVVASQLTKVVVGAALVSGALVAGSLVAGCGHVDVHEAVLRPNEVVTPRAKRADIYLLRQKPARPVYELALVEAFGSGDTATPEQLTAALAERGAQLGCDAVVRVRAEIGRSMGHAYGVCVRYASDAELAAARAAAAKSAPKAAATSAPAPKADDEAPPSDSPADAP